MFFSFPTPADAVKLLEWFKANGITYPWSAYHSQTSVNPYAIWVSEVMLQQTTVSAVLPRYNRWMNRFPDMKSLAEATEDEVYREWEGLGYYSRAKNLHSAAREVQAKYGGQLPKDIDELKTLPGVGNYIAAAVASFAWNKRIAAVDANIRRIIQRIQAADTWSRELERNYSINLVQSMPIESPGKLIAALMQLGQQHCLSHSPKCIGCPLNLSCRARQTDRQAEIPERKRKNIISKSTILAILLYKHHVWMERRTSGIGSGLWVFPPQSALVNPGDWVFSGQLEAVVHTYTRYRDNLIPYVFNPSKRNENQPTPNGQWVALANIDRYAMPSAYRRIVGILQDIL